MTHVPTAPDDPTESLSSSREAGEISCHHKMKPGVVGGVWGESGNVFAVTKLFSDDPKVPAWKESSVVLWWEQREGGREGAKWEVSLHHKGSQIWLGGSQQPELGP